MASQFDLLVQELIAFDRERATGRLFAKAVPAPEPTKKVDFGNLGRKLDMMKKSLAAGADKSATQAKAITADAAKAVAQQKWDGFFKSYTAVYEALSAKLATGTVAPSDARFISANLRRIESRASDLYRREMGQ